MKKTYGGIKLTWLCIPAAIAILGVILGSFCDLNISISIGNPNSFVAKFSETLSAIFGYMLGPIAGTLLFVSLKNNTNKLVKIIAYCFLVGSVVVTTFIFGESVEGGDEAAFTLGFSKAFAYIFSALIMIGTAFATFFLVKNKETSAVFKAGLCIGIILIGELAFLTISKALIGRPRPRFLFETTNDNFKNWWQFDLLRNGKPDDMHKSCPSGHSMTAMATISLCCLSTLFNSEKHAKLPLIIFVACNVYAFLTAFSRVLGGAHFLSDVSLALINTLAISAITYYFVYKERQPKINK